MAAATQETKMRQVELLNDLRPKMQAWRQQLHQRPELAFKEVGTAEFVARQLRSWGLEVESGIAGTGVVARLRAKPTSVDASADSKRPRAIGLRADLDALPMEEANEFPHRSLHAGCFHGCGHDGHTAMLLGAAHYLAEHRDFRGEVIFIFQPAEEGAGGGRVMVDEGLFERFPCDEIYALHNWPSLPLGKIAVRAGAMMAATDQWDLVVRGKGGHAAFPHLTVDPIHVATQIQQAFQGVISRWNDPTHPMVLTTTQFHAGTAYNVIADTATLCGTLRTLDPKKQRQAAKLMHATATGVAAALGAEATFTFQEGYPATINDATCAAYAAQAAAHVVGTENVITDIAPSMGGEDFSFMLAERPGAYLWLGQGDASHTAGLHSSHYDFNDAVLPLGAALHVSLVQSRLALTA